MYFEIGVVAASRIPKGIVFGSLPTRLVKSENNDDGEKFGFIEVQYKNGTLFSQYGPQFNWMKYISASQDLFEQNLEAFIDESAEISFETSQEIERGQELLYTFAKQHGGVNDPNQQQQQQDWWSSKMSKYENRQDWSDRKHDVGCGGNKNNLKLGKSQHHLEDNVHTNVDNKRSGENHGTRHANKTFWLGSATRDDSETTPNDQKNDRQLPWFPVRLRMSRYHPEEKAGPHSTRDDESLEATNGTKACQQNDANWYPLPIGITRPLGCTCTWSQPYLPSRNHKAMYGAYVETRTNADEMPHRETPPDSHLTTSLRKTEATEVPKITLMHETFNLKEDSKSISQEQGKGSSDKMTSDSPTRSEDLLRKISTPRLTNNGESNKATQVQESHTNVKDNIVPTPNPVATSPEHENNQRTQTRRSDHIAEETSEEKPTCESVEETPSDAKDEEKSPSDQVRNGSRFVCDYCGKSYCRRYVLKIHMRTHTGHKPLHCTVCWKSFGDPSNLKKHVRSHARKNAIYTCEHCGRGSFYRLCDLVRHIKFRHRLASAEKWPSSSTTDKKQD